MAISYKCWPKEHPTNWNMSTVDGLPIESKDLKPGTWVMLRNGWYAYVLSKPKGPRVMLLVFGYGREAGDCYIWDIHYAWPNGNLQPPSGLILSKSQDKARKYVEASCGY